MIAGVLAFLMSTVGRYVIIGAVVLAAVFGVRQWGYNAAHRACEAAAKQREIEIAKRDIKIGELSAELDAKIGSQQIKTEEIDNEVQRRLEAEIAKRPIARQCLLDDGDVRSLR